VQVLYLPGISNQQWLKKTLKFVGHERRILGPDVNHEATDYDE
jgi:hypothetical protein